MPEFLQEENIYEIILKLFLEKVGKCFPSKLLSKKISSKSFHNIFFGTFQGLFNHIQRKFLWEVLKKYLSKLLHQFVSNDHKIPNATLSWFHFVRSFSKPITRPEIPHATILKIWRKSLAHDLRKISQKKS